MIYFIRCTATNLVKIGFAADPYKRFSKIQSDSPGELQMLGIEVGEVARERELHRQFADHRRRGEWFDFAPAIAEYAKTLAVPIQPNRRKKLGGKLGEWLHDQQMSLHTFSKMVASTDVSLSRFCSGQHIPGKAVMENIARATNGAVMPNDFYDLSFLDQARDPDAQLVSGALPQTSPRSLPHRHDTP